MHHKFFFFENKCIFPPNLLHSLTAC